MELSWTTVHGATRYELFVWDSVNGWRQFGGDSLTDTTYTYTDLVAGTTYFYIIRAANADGETSAWSDQVCPRRHPLLRLLPRSHPPAHLQPRPVTQRQRRFCCRPTPTASPTVAALAAPVLTAQASEDGVELTPCRYAPSSLCGTVSMGGVTATPTQPTLTSTSSPAPPSAATPTAVNPAIPVRMALRSRTTLAMKVMSVPARPRRTRPGRSPAKASPGLPSPLPALRG